ncbi:MAG: YHS domain-containing protein [Desulfobacterales bacterium]|jgi:Cu+-exporting ATPase
MNLVGTKNKTFVDPVCGMSVKPENTDIEATVEGQTYYFCAEGCREAFVENPKKYLKPKSTKKKSWWCRYTERLEKATGSQSMKCH